MEYVGNYLLVIIEMGGVLSPLLFIILHLIRPMLFLPVVFICISGGILFGPIAGSIYSIIGITMASLLFYVMAGWMPKSIDKLIVLKQRLLGKNTEMTTAQITLLRLVPFIHFHLLSLCLIEANQTFRGYAKSSLISNIPLAIIYTSIGGWISQLSPMYIAVFIIALLPSLYFLRRKEIIIKWQEFFASSSAGTENQHQGLPKPLTPSKTTSS
ncbi:TVP38/TMEM64 family protein [Oceanobacillus jeddahense]|uniref:TVP38/TMEM64 family membrane protein n=1 Tax=Oceanobacillus jeddahense TaxID=1462527 RepID=A0ABY5JXZ6_9BACI|nr:VTT domain-containing protein [Oceanobacillus jeddahense]UUI05267.1 VTT domain-containing protein [Oceanobacillus jeddahense]